jgi:hypothetical protein
MDSRPRDARGRQEAPGAARSSQEQPKAARSSQKQPGAARSSQEAPGGARRRQEAPGGARGRQEAENVCRQAIRSTKTGVWRQVCRNNTVFTERIASEGRNHGRNLTETYFTSAAAVFEHCKTVYCKIRTGVTIFELLLKSPGENYVFKCVFEKTFLVRTRVQSIAFSESFFDFRSGFAMVFENTTKPLREAENW